MGFEVSDSKPASGRRVLDAKDTDFEAQAVAMSQGGLDFVFEASGCAQALAQAIAAAEREATIVQVSSLPTPVSVQLNSIAAKELNFLGSFRFTNVFATALELGSQPKGQSFRLDQRRASPVRHAEGDGYCDWKE